LPCLAPCLAFFTPYPCLLPHLLPTTCLTTCLTACLTLPLLASFADPPRSNPAQHPCRQAARHAVSDRLEQLSPVGSNGAPPAPHVRRRCYPGGQGVGGEGRDACRMRHAFVLVGWPSAERAGCDCARAPHDGLFSRPWRERGRGEVHGDAGAGPRPLRDGVARARRGPAGPAAAPLNIDWRTSSHASREMPCGDAYVSVCVRRGRARPCSARAQRQCVCVSWRVSPNAPHVRCTASRLSL
jgi:hypothetical protein